MTPFDSLDTDSAHRHPAHARDPVAVEPVARRQWAGRHVLYRGDCLRVMERLAAESVDVVVTSPPYNIGLAYRSYGDRRAEQDYLDWMLEVATGVRRLMRPDASFFLNITGSSAMPWLPFELIVRLRGLFRLQNHITWVKSISIGDETVGHFKPINSSRFLHRNHEHVFHLTLDGAVPPKRRAGGGRSTHTPTSARRGHAQDLRCRGDSWFIPYETVRTRSQKFDHPPPFRSCCRACACACTASRRRWCWIPSWARAPRCWRPSRRVRAASASTWTPPTCPSPGTGCWRP